MFLTCISPDAFIQTEGRPFGTNTPGKPPRTFWFQTLSAIEHNMPDNWSTRLAASVLLRHWGGTDTAAAAALIADDETLMSLPQIPENVREAARCFSKLVNPEDAAQNAEEWTILHRLAQITARAREASEFIRGSYHLSPTVTPESIKNWQGILSAIFSHHDLHHPVQNAYAACRDAVAALSDRMLPADYTWCVTGKAKYVKAFLSLGVPRSGLAYLCENDETLFVRTTKLPRSVAVRLMDGVAAAYPKLTFTVAPTDPKKVFQSSFPSAYTRQVKFGEETDARQVTYTCRVDPAEDYRARMEPLFYAENVNPVPAVLASDQCPKKLCCRVAGETAEALKSFLTTAVPLFRLQVTRPSADGKSVVIRGPEGMEAFPTTAETVLLRLLKTHFSALTFTDAEPNSFRFQSGAVPDTPYFPWSSPECSLWEEVLTQRLDALTDPRKRSLFLTPVSDSVPCYCHETGQTIEDLRYPDGDIYDDYEDETDEDGIPLNPYLKEDDEEDEVDSDHYAFQIYFPTLRRTDGTWFYDAAAIPGRTALRKKLAERFPSAEFIGSLSLLSEEDAPMKLRGNNGQFRLVLDGFDAVAFDRDFMDDEGHSLNPLWECRGFRGEDGGIDIPDDYADLDLNP